MISSRRRDVYRNLDRGSIELFRYLMSWGSNPIPAMRSSASSRLYHDKEKPRSKAIGAGYLPPVPLYAARSGGDEANGPE